MTTRVKKPGKRSIARIKRAALCRLEEFDALDREKTLFILPVGALEVHGYHLTNDTDMVSAVVFAEEAAKTFAARHGDWTVMIMPLLNIGTDELPLPGSIEFSRATVYRALKEYARSLWKYGFRNLMITNGHGGLRHNLAIDDACRTCNRKYGMKMVSPCVRVYQNFIFGKRFHLVEEELGRKMTPVEKAGFTDLEHAGGWETSIMLAENAPLVARDYRAYHSSRLTVGEKLRRLARILEKIILALPLFNRILKALDLSMEEGVRIMMTAVKLYDQKKTRFTYSGDPSVAQAAIGRAFEKAISREIVTLVETVYFGGTAKPSSIVSNYSLFFFLRRDFMRGALWTAAFLVIGAVLFFFRGAL